MSRVVINPYGASNSAKALAEALECKRLKTSGTRFVAKNTDTVINWGIGKAQYRGTAGLVLNNTGNVKIASDKLITLRYLQANYVSIPNFVTSYYDITGDGVWVGRKTLHGHSGAGISVGTSDDVSLDADCPLYVEYIPKKREYRAIVVGNTVVDFKQKKKRNSVSEDNPEGWEGEHDEHVWNLDGGYVFARNNVTKPSGIDELAVDATTALGLDFGAVDIIEGQDNTLYVLEINTAFGLEGTTTELVATAIKELIDGTV